MTMDRLENHKYTIAEAYSHCSYIVPDYQREYVWTEKEITQLLVDIDEQMNSSSSEYFIGTTLVSKKEGLRNHYEIIDGQQRLTTMFLILCALRALFQNKDQGNLIDKLLSDHYTKQDGSVEKRLKLDPRYEQASDVILQIVEAKGDINQAHTAIAASSIRIHDSVKNILNAYDVIYHFLTTHYCDKNKLEGYWGHLARNVVFIQISTDVGSALKIFETINERGVGLNPMDLLKNLLFAEMLPEDFPRLKDDWKKITSALETNKEKPLRFLRYFLMANYSIKKKGAIVREDEIYGWLKENTAAAGYKEDPFRFVRLIKRNVDSYIAFRNGNGNDGKPNTYLESLKKLSGDAFSLHYVLLLSAANLAKPVFDQFIEQLECFLFFYIFTKTPTKYLEQSFSIWADEVRKISSIESPSEQKAKLNEFVKGRFAPRMREMTPELEDAFKRLSLGPIQKYRIKYLLARLTQHVDMARLGQKAMGSLDSYFRFEIEHILPNEPKDELRAEWQAKHAELSYDEIKNHLGNLTLLEKPDNIVASNDSYAKKLTIYAKSGNYLTRSLYKLDDVGNDTSVTRINEKLSSYEKWGVEEIEDRQARLFELALDIWKTTEIK